VTEAVIRRRVRVEGRVQGVFFRDTCARTARQLGVNGWVANREDGSVEAVFEGQVRAVEAMLRWAGHGPARARVDQVVVSEEAPQGESAFRVR
jgi:acylphosphatase